MQNSRPKDNLAEIRELPSGVKLAVEAMPGMESFTLGFFLPVGATNENRDNSGISHFIEHILFKGTKNRSAKSIVKAIERVGGIINASTGREITYFYIRIASKRLDLALDVLTDLVFNPAMEAASIEKEKGVILEEIHMNEDDPGQALYDRFIKSVYSGSSYGRPILGSPASILAYTKRDLIQFHHAHYSPKRLTASIAGGIDPDKVQDILEKRLDRFPVRKPAIIRNSPAPRFKPNIQVYSKDVEQAALMIGFPSAGIKSPYRYAFSLLDALLAGGMMSRLFQEIREKRGLVYSIDSTHQPYRNGGLFTIEAGMREENLLTVLNLVLREIRRMAEEGPRKHELADVKLFLQGHWALGLESTSARMIRNAMATLFFNRILPHNEVVDKLNAVTVDDVAHAASEALKNGGPAVGALSRFDNGAKIGEIEEKIAAIRANKGKPFSAGKK